MTENEAIEYLTAYLECESKRSRIEGCNNNCNECELCYLQGTTNQHLEAVKMAIQALETVKKLSDRNMTIEVLENYMQFEDECVKKGFTLKSVIEARDKQIAKKPTYEGDGYAPDGTLIYDTWICPCCGKSYEVDYDNYDYCPNCGQKLDWSDEE